MKKWQFQGSLIFLLAVSQRSFVDTAPTVAPRQGAPEVVPETLDDSVRELESLKQTIGKTLEMMKSHSSMYSDINGHRESHSESRSEVKQDGKLVAGVDQHVDAHASQSSDDGQTASGTVLTNVDVPSKGIHKSTVQSFVPDFEQQQFSEKRNHQTYENVQDSDSNSLEKLTSYSGTASQYSPLDMAEYVFWTGDEKGVTLAIEEFLQEGLMSREEAIAFLQEIKFNLDYLQSHYTQLGLNAWDRSKENNMMSSQQLPKPRQQSTVQTSNGPELKNKFDITKLRSQMNKKSEPTKGVEIENPKTDVPSNEHQQQDEQDYDELLERLRMADFLYTEYSLEEVIYQLAKVMFTQSLTKGSAEAQQALQKFTTFLESEADQGHISRALEKKVLDVLIASLTDTLSEHPELHDADVRAHAEKQAILQQILQMAPKNNKDLQTQRLAIQLKDDNHVPLSLGKYKTIR